METEDAIDDAAGRTGCDRCDPRHILEQGKLPEVLSDGAADNLLALRRDRDRPAVYDVEVFGNRVALLDDHTYHRHCHHRGPQGMQGCATGRGGGG